MCNVMLHNHNKHNIALEAIQLIQTLKLSNSQTSKLSNFQTSNSQTLKLSNSQTLKLSNVHTSQTFKLSTFEKGSPNVIPGKVQPLKV